MYHEPDTIPFSTSVPTVTTVHDLSVLLYPQWHPAHRVAKYAHRFERGVQQTSLFLTDASTTKRDLVQRVGIAEERIRVVPLAPRPAFRVIPWQEVAAARLKLGLPARYVLFIGTIEPRKNVEGLLHAYARLPPRLRHDCPLVLAGGWGWNSQTVQRLLTQPPFETNVVWLGYLSDEDLVAVTNGASVLAYPSFYEGFGLPPLEAMGCNVPVITTHAGSLKEVVGDAAWIVDPCDEIQIAHALRELLTDNRLANDFRRRGRNHVAQFSWLETARQTLEAYRQVA
jgi:alpha-1,3-rhamnosyl/mannosyltransferase